MPSWLKAFMQSSWLRPEGRVYAVDTKSIHAELLEEGKVAGTCSAVREGVDNGRRLGEWTVKIRDDDTLHGAITPVNKYTVAIQI